MLIAPALKPELVAHLKREVLELPTLVFWAREDNTVPYSQKEQLLDSFPRKDIVLFDDVLSDVNRQWEAHTPENIKVTPGFIQIIQGEE